MSDSENLADTFGAAAKEDLGTILPPRGSKPSPVHEVVPDQRGVDEPTQRLPAVTAAAQAVATAAGDSTAEVPLQVTVYMSPAAITAARKWRARTGRTNAELAFEAIWANRARLAELVVGRQGPAVDVTVNELFPARARRRRPGANDSRGLWSIKATASEIRTIDKLVEDARAASRSELISAAVEAFLTPVKRGGRSRQT
jgi:hypothetical protein